MSVNQIGLSYKYPLHAMLEYCIIFVIVTFTHLPLGCAHPFISELWGWTTYLPFDNIFTFHSLFGLNLQNWIRNRRRPKVIERLGDSAAGAPPTIAATYKPVSVSPYPITAVPTQPGTILVTRSSTIGTPPPPKRACVDTNSCGGCSGALPPLILLSFASFSSSYSPSPLLLLFFLYAFCSLLSYITVPFLHMKYRWQRHNDSILVFQTAATRVQ